MESSDLEKYGGYNAQFLHELLDDYECPVCSMALREPVLTLCGHRLCFSCSEEIKKRNYGVLVCPLDKTILNSEKVFPDKFTERAILQLKVKCDNFLKSCQWTGELKTINNHLTSCEYQEVKCLNEQCTATLLRKELSDHMEKHCIYRLVTCRYCKQKIICSENQMSSHITDSCANTIIPCQYLNIGCKFKGMRKEHEIHANSSMQNHLSMAISKLDAIENKLTLTMDTLENKIVSKLNALENKITSKMESLENKVASESIALENKITSKMESLETKVASDSIALEKKITLKVESFENRNASEVVSLKNKITFTVDELKNELISKVDAQNHEIMLHERNLEVIKAFLAVEMELSKISHERRRST
ncbi:TNF receptor-associated factor 6-A isoform X5 [Hydra vulgaris]|uniref:TNF receptor-associated factor 6-A isoform X5 n=1 Tax=Hydra vulgaris TaxID=6087 RepID=UPI001F5FB582|nr:TNF receptor-associated factor 6-A-like isoform X4 [Hydra vulgaris]